MHRQTSPRTESSLGANDPAFRRRYKLGFQDQHAEHADFLRELDFMPAHVWHARHADFGLVFVAKPWVYDKSADVWKAA